jgi:hypothetical protein
MSIRWRKSQSQPSVQSQVMQLSEVWRQAVDACNRGARWRAEGTASGMSRTRWSDLETEWERIDEITQSAGSPTTELAAGDAHRRAVDTKASFSSTIQIPSFFFCCDILLSAHLTLSELLCFSCAAAKKYKFTHEQSPGFLCGGRDAHRVLPLLPVRLPAD